MDVLVYHIRGVVPGTVIEGVPEVNLHYVLDVMLVKLDGVPILSTHRLLPVDRVIYGHRIRNWQIL